jgi:hypothetical protein
MQAAVFLAAKIFLASGHTVSLRQVNTTLGAADHFFRSRRISGRLGWLIKFSDITLDQKISDESD